MKLLSRPRARLCAHIASLTAVAVFGANLSNAATLFTDGFESGTLSKTPQNGVAWNDSASTAVSSGVAATGKYSLAFNFAAVPMGEDSWAEQRISMPQKSEYWFKYKLYIPSNYYHRVDDESNNKFLAVYQSPYQKTNSGFQVNFSLQPNGSGGSDVEVHHYNGGSEGPVAIVYRNFITETDKGKWMDLIAQVKVPTSSTSKDGIMKMWKNGTQVASITNLPSWGGTGKNYFDAAYFLGWSNSGFTQKTVLNIDDVTIADSAITAGPIPNPPTNVTVQ